MLRTLRNLILTVCATTVFQGAYAWDNCSGYNQDNCSYTPNEYQTQNYCCDNSNSFTYDYSNAYGLDYNTSYDWGNTYSFDPCCDNYDPCWQPGPLRCGSIGIQVGGGWCWINNTHKGKVWLTVPAAIPAVFSVSRVAQFHNQFKSPWIVNGLLTYNLTDHVQLFGELNYRHADGKTYDFTAGTFSVSEVTSNFRSWAWYIGARYFLDRMFCDKLSPFVGFKTGLVRTHQINYDLYLGGSFVETGPYWLGNTGVSGGLQLGADYAITDNIGIVLTLEVVATQGLRNNRNNLLDPALTGGLTNVNIGDSGIQMSYPITLGLRYNF